MFEGINHLICLKYFKIICSSDHYESVMQCHAFDLENVNFYLDIREFSILWHDKGEARTFFIHLRGATKFFTIVEHFNHPSTSTPTHTPSPP